MQDALLFLVASSILLSVQGVLISHWYYVNLITVHSTTFSFFTDSEADYGPIDTTLEFRTPNRAGFMLCESISISNDSVPEPVEVFSVGLGDPSMLDDIIILGSQIVNVTISDCKYIVLQVGTMPKGKN